MYIQCTSHIHIIGERERANLVVQLARFYIMSQIMSRALLHTVMFLNKCNAIFRRLTHAFMQAVNAFMQAINPFMQAASPLDRLVVNHCLRWSSVRSLRSHCIALFLVLLCEWVQWHGMCVAICTRVFWKVHWCMFLIATYIYRMLQYVSLTLPPSLPLYLSIYLSSPSRYSASEAKFHAAH